MRLFPRTRLTLLVLAVLATPAGLAAQSVTERTPNLSGGWIGVPNTAHFNFLHRFEHGDPPARKVLNYPTFLMGYTATRNLLLAANYATNSDLVAGYPNEWELMARVGKESGTTRFALTGAYNLASESVDGEALARVGTNRVGVIGVARAFSNGYGGDARFALGGGGTLSLHPNLSLAGDVVTLLDRDDAAGEDIAWGVAAQIRIPTTPHTLSLQVGNTNTSTLEGSSRGGSKIRSGFEFTIPLTLSRWFGGGGGGATGGGAAGAATDMTSQDTVVVTIRDFEFSPANITIRPGATVVFVNEGQVAHTATQTGSFDTGLIEPRARASYTFRTAGEHDYICTPHPFMKGRIVVQGGER